jgi:hypothetical protein
LRCVTSKAFAADLRRYSLIELWGTPRLQFSILVVYRRSILPAGRIIAHLRKSAATTSSVLLSQTHKDNACNLSGSSIRDQAETSQ